MAQNGVPTFTNALNDEALFRRRSQREEDLRGHFFRDTTAIIHSYPFRRLKHKTQVFFAPKNDHICTRIEHVMHVATISATLCKALGLDGDLAWAISLGHDLGHTPFGHLGERVIDTLLHDSRGFIHELYSLRVVDHLINYGKGLNLTYAVRDGIATHCGELFERQIIPDFTVKSLDRLDNRENYPATWEGAVVRVADKMAYLGRDMEDAMQLKIIDKADIPSEVSKNLGVTNSAIIDSLVNDVYTYSKNKGVIGFSERVYETVLKFKDFNYGNIYNSPFLSKYHNHFKRILTILFDYLGELFDRYGYDSTEYVNEQNVLAVRFGDYVQKMSHFYTERGETSESIILDYVAGMTDDYAIDSVSEIIIPKRMTFQFDEFLLS